MNCHALLPGKWHSAQPHLLPGDTHHSSGRVMKSSPGRCAAAQASDCGFVCQSPPACSRSHSGQCCAGLRTDSPLRGGRREGALAKGILTTVAGWKGCGARALGLGKQAGWKWGNMVELSSQNAEATLVCQNQNCLPLGGMLCYPSTDLF